MTESRMLEIESQVAQIAADFKAHWIATGNSTSANRTILSYAFHDYCDSHDIPASVRNLVWRFVCDGFGRP